MSGSPTAEVSAVMPAFNEAGNLERSVGQLAAALKRHARGFEIIVVDDGSRDGSAMVLERDVNCAFKLMRRDLVNRMALHSDGALINTELLVLARQLQARIVEVPVHHFSRTAGTPTGANPRVVLRAFRELFVFRAELRKVEKAA